MPSKLAIALAPGDGIGPEIMDAVLHVFGAAGVLDQVEFVDAPMGATEFAKGNTTGIADSATEALEGTGLLFKGPMGTPIGGGGKSINVTLRKTFGAYANLREFQSLPGVETVFSRAGVPVDFFVVRENVEDTYGGVEHRLSPDVTAGMRIITAPGCDQIHTFAFETAKRLGLKTVTCGHKANIMKMTDGLFLDRFRFVAKDFPDIEANDVIIDALCMNLVLRPDKFEMVVLPNLQGDIVSDLAAGLVGGLGFAPSANIGDRVSIFEAVHGTAPDIAGKDLANPTSLLLSGLIMLRHIGLVKQAAAINNALLVTLESGIHTGDVKGDKDPVGTKAFAKAIAANLGKAPTTVAAKPGSDLDTTSFTPAERPKVNQMMRTFTRVQSCTVGADVFIESTEGVLELAQRMQRLCASTPFELTMISNRGSQIWPTGSVYTELVDCSRCRFELRDKAQAGRIGQGPTVHLLAKIAERYEINAFYPLSEYDGERGFSLAQGQ
ncbi:MAG: isocitrate dehydrogenase [Phycisphaerales bacterium]|jgi:isocitrate dehydrogenase